MARKKPVRPSGGRRMPEFDFDFTLLLVSSGLMIGLMYALIALGFVLVYKATDAINFAQGEFVMFAAIMAAAAMGASLPFWLASRHRAGRHDRRSASDSSASCCASFSAGRSSP